MSFSAKGKKKTQGQRREPGQRGRRTVPADWQVSRWNLEWLKKKSHGLPRCRDAKASSQLSHEKKHIINTTNNNNQITNDHHDQSRNRTIQAVSAKLLGLPRSPPCTTKPIPVPVIHLGDSWPDRCAVLEGHTFWNLGTGSVIAREGSRQPWTGRNPHCGGMGLRGHLPEGPRTTVPGDP